MKALIEVKIRPFQVPNFVIVEAEPKLKQDGMMEPSKYALNELDAETLHALCEEFTRSVFDKAGKSRPARSYP